jgi:hypothetical protein
MVSVLASIVATASRRSDAQVTVYRDQTAGNYNPYFQGSYAGYGNYYASSPRVYGGTFQSHGTMVGNGPYGYARYGNVPPGYGYQVDDSSRPYVRVYGRASYYRPHSGPVYMPSGY